MTYIFENFKYQTLNEKYNYFIFIKNYIYIYIYKLSISGWVWVILTWLDLKCSIVLWLFGRQCWFSSTICQCFMMCLKFAKKNSYKFFSYNNFPCLVTCCIIHNMLLGCNNIYAKNILNFIEFKTTTLKLVFKPQ